MDVRGLFNAFRIRPKSFCSSFNLSKQLKPGDSHSKSDIIRLAMKLLQLCAVPGAIAQHFISDGPASAPASQIPFSSSFVQPTPPFLKPEFKANWIQHKW